MEGHRIKGGFIDFAKTDFKCPYCQKENNDRDEKYLNRCAKNQAGTTSIKCDSCGEKYRLAYSYMGEAIAFK